MQQRAELIDIYERKLHLDEYKELREKLENAVGNLPDELLAGYLKEAQELNIRDNTPREKEEGFKKLTAICNKMAVGATVETVSYGSTIHRLQDEKLPQNGGDEKFSVELDKLETNRVKRTVPAEKKEKDPKARPTLEEKKEELRQAFSDAGLTTTPSGPENYRLR